MKGERVLGCLGKGLVVAIVVSAVFLVVSSCPPWSLKVIRARRAACQHELFVIYSELEDRRIPLDAGHVKEIEAVIAELGLTCTEGSDVKGRPAGYHVEVRPDGVVLTEEPGNHPARKRFMAGRVPEERFQMGEDGMLRRHDGR